MKRIVKKNYKLIMGMVVGLLLSSIGVYAVGSLTSDEISYDNGSSGIEAETMQQAIDKLYERTKSYQEYIPNEHPNRKIEKAYKYDENRESDTYCVTGEEQSCFATTCYDNKSKNACEAGTIIDYKVNDNTTERFHVLYDGGEKMTLQSQKNTVSKTAWYANEQDTSKGPTTILNALEQVTKDWTNVNEIEYTAGKTPFNGNAFTGCRTIVDYKAKCESNAYILETRKVRARMITVLEAQSMRCLVSTGSNGASCLNFMYNYVNESDNSVSGFMAGYWTMSDDNKLYAWIVTGAGTLTGRDPQKTDYGARAVVEINK